MRLFVGLDLPYELRRNLGLLVEMLRRKADIHWSPPANLHITTKFIGEWPEARLPELKSALGDIPRPGPLPLALRGLGWFPNPHSPRVFYCGIAAPPELHSLARQTEAACQSVGISPENKEFRPHLTLARIKHPTPLAPLQQAIAALPGVEFGAWQADRFHLYSSDLRPGGSVYTKLATFPLTPALP